MYNYYLCNKNRKQDFTNYVGTITFEEAQNLNIVWSYVKMKTGYFFPLAILEDPILSLDVIYIMYNFCIDMQMKNNPEYYFTKKAKKRYMILYDNIITILDIAIKNNSDLWIELD